MHSDIAKSCSFCCSDACAGGPPPGSFFLQVAWAASNEGEATLIPAGIWIPPPPLGSGKFETPCERMHSENAKKLPLLPPEWLDLLADEPQAAIATVQPTMAAAAHGRGRDAYGRMARTVSF